MIVAMQRMAKRPRTVMSLWAGVSFGWLAGLAVLAWLQIEGQVQAGHEVARDVAGLDCEGSAAVAKCLAAAEAAVGVSWGDIAAVAWQYEAIAILAYCFLPPLSLLLVALLAMGSVRVAGRAVMPRRAVSRIHLEVAMKKSMVSTLALSALVAGALIGSAAAQTAGVGVGTPIGPPGILIAPAASQPGSVASTGSAIATGAFGGNSGLGIGPGMLAGAGPPTDGLDSNPYAEAPPRVRAALGGRVNRAARTGGSGPLN
jgi:hypothetical protein